MLELLAVIAIIALLAVLASVATGKARASARVAKDIANLRQTASLVLTAAADRGRLPGRPANSALFTASTDNWIRVVDLYITNTFAKNGVDPSPQDPNHIYLCPSLFDLRPDVPRVGVNHQWAMNAEVSERPLISIARPSKTVMFTTAQWQGSWGELEFYPSRRVNPDFPYPPRRLSLTDPSGAGPPDRQTLAAFVDGHVERISFRDTNYFPINANKPAWKP